MEKSFLFILNRPPYQGSSWRDALDSLLATSAFGQQVSVLLLGDAVLQLLPVNETEVSRDYLAMKSPRKHFDSFALYDIDTVYVASAALQRLSLRADQLSVAAVSVDIAQIRRLLSEHDVCLSF
jgi:tRNA 2-thiouridine synthesizing protein C